MHNYAFKLMHNYVLGHQGKTKLVTFNSCNLLCKTSYINERQKEKEKKKDQMNGFHTKPKAQCFWFSHVKDTMVCLLGQLWIFQAFRSPLPNQSIWQ